MMSKLIHGGLSAVLLAYIWTAIAAPAQTITTVLNFNGANGGFPTCALVQASDGYLYGTTHLGGTSNVGTVFKVTATGAVTTLYSFSTTEGNLPYSGVTLASDGTVYGTTWANGAWGWGTIFSLSPGGTLSTLHSFLEQQGGMPVVPMIEDTDGNFYGVTASGGYGALPGNGSIFRIRPAGQMKVLYKFCKNPTCPDGSYPGGLVQVGSEFYGTTDQGGVYNSGTVFKIDPKGTLVTLASFQGGGGNPYGWMILASNGKFYGTTDKGGANGYGSVFEVTADGVLTTLHSFDATDGVDPESPLVQGTDGNLYSVAKGGGANNLGVLYQITPSGKFQVLHSFQGTDGSGPIAGMMQDTDGNFYGSTSAGGSTGNGTLFQLSMGLPPFVTLTPAAGAPGTTVTILGTDLSGTSVVSFNGIGATFSILSPTQISATVPAGATMGKVQVVTPTGTLLSNVAFRVQP